VIYKKWKKEKQEKALKKRGGAKCARKDGAIVENFLKKKEITVLGGIRISHKCPGSQRSKRLGSRPTCVGSLRSYAQGKERGERRDLDLERGGGARWGFTYGKGTSH